MAVKTPLVSTLNPNAPLYVPAAFAAAEEYSVEWYRLMETSPAFQEYWLSQCYDDSNNGEAALHSFVDDDYLYFEELEREILEAEREEQELLMQAKSDNSSESLEIFELMMQAKSDNGADHAFLCSTNQSLIKETDVKNVKKVWPDQVKYFDKVPAKLANSPRKVAITQRIQQPRP